MLIGQQIPSSSYEAVVNLDALIRGSKLSVITLPWLELLMCEKEMSVELVAIMLCLLFGLCPGFTCRPPPPLPEMPCSSKECVRLSCILITAANVAFTCSIRVLGGAWTVKIQTAESELPQKLAEFAFDNPEPHLTGPLGTFVPQPSGPVGVSC